MLMPPVEEKVEVAVEKLMPFVFPTERSEPGVDDPMPTFWFALMNSEEVPISAFVPEKYGTCPAVPV